LLGFDQKGDHMYIGLTRREILIGLGKGLITLPFTAFMSVTGAREARAGRSIRKEGHMKLPQPRFEGEVFLEQTIRHRRTVRSFGSHPLTLAQCSQILWAAQGITDDRGFKRAAPSAGALYPMDIYAVVGQHGVESLDAGIYHYEPGNHAVFSVFGGDIRKELAAASLSQMWMATAPLDIVITAEYQRINIKYGQRGKRYAMMESGHIAQNVFLQGGALGLGVGIVGAFDDEDVNRLMKIPKSHEPLLIMPVGYKR
jgi:SagB-type dehydrogenase family enzyme